MPLYEYECESCDHRFEVIQKFSDPLVESCPKCGGPVHKLFSSPAFHLKGTGWYITDYAKKESGGTKSESDASDKTATDKPTESKTESASGSAKEKDTKETKDSKAASKAAKESKPAAAPKDA
jgi:putative FmdB family regulatory protein